jgi:hypothetical protein
MLKVDIAYNILANLFPHYFGCTNRPDSSSTACIGYAASKSLVTPSTQTSPAISLESIIVIQSGGDKMRTTHTADLLLSKLPPNACMGHSLPGLTNDLPSIEVLCNAGCKEFFNATGCEVTFDGKVILQGWHDPKHCLWHVCIVDDGGTTNLKIDDNVTTPQTTAIMHSLYDCNNAQQLTHFYHACLFLPVVSTLTTAINKGYVKGFPGLTAQRTCHHVQINDVTKKGHMNQTCQGQGSMHPTLPTPPTPTTCLTTMMSFLTILARA